MSKTYTISELANEFDVTVRSIRFYEDSGLLHPTRKGQTRIYSSKDRVRLKLILRGKRLGFSLAESKELFDLWDNTHKGSEQQLRLMLDIIEKKREGLRQQLSDIAMANLELDNAEARCRDALSELGEKDTADTAGNSDSASSD